MILSFTLPLQLITELVLSRSPSLGTYQNIYLIHTCFNAGFVRTIQYI